jgi:hypothetical protein
MRTAHLLLVPALLALASPAAAQPDQRVWAIALPKQGDAVLRFAFPNTEDLMVGLTCAKKTGQVRVIGASPVRLNEMRDPDAPPAKPVVLKRRATVTVSSGEAGTSIPGEVGPDGQHGGSYIMTELSTAAPVIAAFRKTGRLRINVQREVVEAPPAPGGLVRKFLGYCR